MSHEREGITLQFGSRILARDFLPILEAAAKTFGGMDKIVIVLGVGEIRLQRKDRCDD